MITNEVELFTGKEAFKLGLAEAVERGETKIVGQCQLLRLKEVGACPYPYQSLLDARFKRFCSLVGQTSSGG